MKGEQLGEFEELVLLTIGIHLQATSSVGIKAALREHAGRAASLGAIYTALERLERKGFVDSWLGTPTAVRGGRRKRLYKVTKSGAAAVKRARRVREALWELQGTSSVERRPS